MAAMYGILVEGKVKPGKWPEMKAALTGHFLRQLDGREPGATCATIMELRTYIHTYVLTYVRTYVRT